MGFFIKTISIYNRKNAGYYYQNNDWGGKLVTIGLD